MQGDVEGTNLETVPALPLQSLCCFASPHKPQFWATPEDPNHLNLLAVNPNRDERRAYERQRAYNGLYRAAARLWACGVPMKQALSIVRRAVNEARDT